MTVNGSQGQLLPYVEPTILFAKSEGDRNGSAQKRVGSPGRLSPTQVSPFIAALAMLVAGCAVGPDFEKPAAPEVQEYTATPLSPTVSSPNVAGGEAQRFANGGSISADWWTLFHSKPLNELIEQSLANNHDLKAAQAALLVAQENVLAQRGAYYPSVTGGLSASPPAGPIGVARARAELQCLSIQSLHPAGQRFVRARCLRPEPPDRGVIAGAGSEPRVIR